MFFRIISYLIFPLALTYYYLRSKIRGKKLVIKERFIPPEVPPKKGKRLWIHGVSVGEILSLYPLAVELKNRGLEVVVSTTTFTGMAVAKKRFRGFYVFHFPFDLPVVLKRFFRIIEPDGVVIAETELWPNFISTARSRGVPVFLVNGRLSQGSFVWYRRLRFFMENIMEQFELICVQSENYRDMFLKIGAPPSRVIITGNMKADFEISRGEAGFEISKPYMVAGSTMDLEEDRFILTAFRRSRVNVKLILAPRHPERADESLRTALALGFNAKKRTEMKGEWDVLILDTMGELATLYSGAILSIIGGSIKPFGGHNLLEPAFFASPIAFGPHMENFRDLAEEFLREKAALVFETEDELAEIIRKAEEREFEDIGRRGYEVLNRLKGATRRNAELILSRI